MTQPIAVRMMTDSKNTSRGTMTSAETVRVLCEEREATRTAF